MKTFLILFFFFFSAISFAKGNNTNFILHAGEKGHPSAIGSCRVSVDYEGEIYDSKQCRNFAQYSSKIPRLKIRKGGYKSRTARFHGGRYGTASNFCLNIHFSIPGTSFIEPRKLNNLNGDFHFSSSNDGRRLIKAFTGPVPQRCFDRTGYSVTVAEVWNGRVKPFIYRNAPKVRDGFSNFLRYSADKVDGITPENWNKFTAWAKHHKETLKQRVANGEKLSDIAKKWLKKD